MGILWRDSGMMIMEMLLLILRKRSLSDIFAARSARAGWLNEARHKRFAMIAVAVAALE